MSGVVEGDATDGDERQGRLECLEAQDRVGVGLRLSGKDGADGDVIDRFR